MSDEFYPARSDEFYPNRRAPSPDPRPAAQPGAVKEAVRRELADVEASLDDAISYLVDLAGAKPTPMSPQNCRIHIDHARMSARNLAALAAPVSQEPVAWLVSCPDDEIYGRGPDKLQFHPLAQHDIDNGYRAKPLYATPQPLTEGEPREAEVERVAARLWKAEAEDAGAPASVAQGRTRAAFDEQSDGTKDRWRKFARAALLAVKSKGGQADG